MIVTIRQILQLATVIAAPSTSGELAMTLASPAPPAVSVGGAEQRPSVSIIIRQVLQLTALATAGVGMLAVTLTSLASASITVAVPGSLGGGGGGSNAYDNPAYPQLTTTQLALDYLLYVPPQIGGFSNSIGTVEIGSTVTAVNLTWSLNKTMTSLLLQGSPITPSLTAISLSGLHLVSDTTYALSASDGTSTTGASTTVAFRPRRWWGTSPLATLTSSDILALGSSEFASSRGQSRSLSATASYLWFAWPSSFGGPASFVVNGLPSSGWVRSVVSATNASGFTQNYDVYRSQFLQNGSGIAVTVS